MSHWRIGETKAGVCGLVWTAAWRCWQPERTEVSDKDEKDENDKKDAKSAECAGVGFACGGAGPCGNVEHTPAARDCDRAGESHAGQFVRSRYRAHQCRRPYRSGRSLSWWDHHPDGLAAGRLL